MKAILISIKPEWVEKILNGYKTIEIRKTMPKCDLPIDVYIYVTKDRNNILWKSIECNEYFQYYFLDCWHDDDIPLNGKVVAKFTMNKVERVYQCNSGFVEEKGCISRLEFFEYLDLVPFTHLGYDKHTYAWHIDNLVIFDEPKELSEFKTKAPQSWCYVEVKE